MRLISDELATHLAGDVTTLATCYLVIRTDGVTFAATDHDQDIVFDEVTYLAASGYNASDVASKSDMSVDNLQIVGFLQSPNITEDDLLAGLWDFADFEIFTVNWGDLTQGKMIERSGKLGEVTCERSQFTCELRGLMQAYTRSIGRIEGPACTANLGDSRCKVRLNPPVWQANTAYAVISGGSDASVGSIVSPTTPNGFIFFCGTAGTSGSSEPTWTLLVGGVTTDGTAVWQSFPALTVVGTVDSVNADRLTLYDAARTEAGPTGGVAITHITNANPAAVTTGTAHGFTEGEVITIAGVVGPTSLNVTTVAHNPSGTTFTLNVDTTDTGDYPPYVSGGTATPFGDSGFFTGGVMTMTSGLNTGLAMEVKAYVPGQITLQLPFPYTVAPGDTYSMTAGCDKSLETCRDRFFNVNNMRGFPYIPGVDKITQVARHQ
jgi:hypothetical protein